jgi:polyhydroxybutyrate depolymerase
LAASAKFVVPIPTESAGHGTWAGVADGPAAKTSTMSDSVNSVVNDVGANVNVEPRRCYATGHQQRRHDGICVTCNTGTFAVIGPDSATQLDNCAAPHPTSVLHIHGTADGPVTTSCTSAECYVYCATVGKL